VRQLLVLTLAATAGLFGQTSILSCQATANPPLVRAEGITERTGDIVLNCFGGQPNAIITGNLSIFLNVAITNRILANGNADAILLLDNGGGYQQTNIPARAATSGGLVWPGLTITLSSEGRVNLKIQNVRAAAAQMNPNSSGSIVATLTFNAGALVSFLSNGFNVGTVQRGLYVSNTSPLICSYVGSPGPESLSLSSALAERSFYSTVRITEGFPSAFGTLADFTGQNANSGTRFILRYSGIPRGARIYTPSFIAGNDATAPTSAGDYGTPAGGGQYQSGSGSLLLVRVVNAGPNGGGGVPSQTLPQFGANFFDSLEEVSYSGDGGSAFAVYEVLDANSGQYQSAQIPSFLSLPRNAIGQFTTIQQDVLFASLSTLQEVRTAPETHIPRFVGTVLPPPDCSIRGDCLASYFPRLAVNANAIEVTTDNSRTVESRYLSISNAGSGNFLWQARVAYVSGSSNSWLRLSPPAGINTETIKLDIVPFGLLPGKYEATVEIDAGQIAGRWSTKVTVQIATGPPPAPIIRTITNAANRVPGPLVAGSMAAIAGERLIGSTVEVYFNSVYARIVTANPTELLVQVPFEMKDLPTANVTVIANGVASATFHTYFAESAPAIFPNYVLNADSSLNTDGSPARAGKLVHVYGTGLPLSGSFTAQVHDVEGLTPEYAGVAPGVIGMQLISVIVPEWLPTMTTDVRICGGPTLENLTCSPPHPIRIEARPPSEDPPE
jgi:uncharacterized protein (TIGR03437 family)